MQGQLNRAQKHERGAALDLREHRHLLKCCSRYHYRQIRRSYSRARRRQARAEVEAGLDEYRDDSSPD